MQQSTHIKNDPNVNSNHILRHLPIIIRRRRPTFCRKDQRPKDDNDPSKEWRYRSLEWEICEVPALGFVCTAEAEVDDCDGYPSEEGEDAGNVEKPGEDDSGAPDCCEEGETRYRKDKSARNPHQSPYFTQPQKAATHSNAGTGTPRFVTYPNTRGAFPSRARESSMRLLA